MSQTAPETAPAPEHEGLFGRVRSWFAGDVEPRIETAEVNAAKALIHAEALAPQLTSLANVVLTLAKAADPAAAPEVAAAVAVAEKIAGELERIGNELLSKAQPAT